MYFPLIDLLRFIAAFAVMSFHFFSGSLHGHGGAVGLFVNYGYLGVPLFFIISGFVIYFSLEKPLKEYALNRFLRLYPLFWAVCTFTYIMTKVFPGGHALPLTDFLKNLLIVNNGDVSKMVDGSYWTLTMEILFYFYIGVFVWWFGLKKLEWFYGLWLLLCVLAFHFGVYNSFIIKIFLVRYTPYFVFGGVLGLLFEKWAQANSFARFRYSAMLILSALLPLYISRVLNLVTGPVTNLFGVYGRQELIIVESFFIVIPLAVYFSRYITKKGLITAAKIAGGVTYPLYLLHQTNGQLLIGAKSTYGRVSSWSLLIAGIMVLAAYLVYVYELKLRKRLHKFIDSKWLKK